MSNTWTFVISYVCLASQSSSVAKTLTLGVACKLYKSKAKLANFIFSHSFELMRMKFNVVLKQLKLIILILGLMNQRKWLLFYWQHAMTNAGICFNHYLLNLFKHSSMVDNIELYMLILNDLGLDSRTEEAKFLRQLSRKVHNWFKWNLVYCENWLD